MICVASIAASALAQEESSLALNAKALDLKQQGKYAESVVIARRSLELSKKVFGPYHDNTIESLKTLAEIYRSQGKFQRQEGLLKRILAIKTLSMGDKVTEKDYAEIAGALRSLAKFYRDRRRYVKAEKVMRRAINFEEKIRGEDYPGRSDDLADMIGLLEAQGRVQETTALYEKLLPALERSGPAKDENVARALGKLAQAYLSQKRYADAEGLLKRSIDITERILGPDDRSLSVYLNNLAVVYSRQRKYTD
ncbi:MAG: tetratricopeptide repeat protein, partial [Candidatus Omnitrophica bacterium]|nr:tetratricopeptide repeat protein [Candidatus Omnitrophota bacterium]